MLTDIPTLLESKARPFPPDFHTNWPVRCRNLGAYTSGQEAYIELMQKRYDNKAHTINTAYNTDFRILGY